jgi:hypothetical protein
MLYTTEHIIIEVISAVACFILARFMIKPYQLTGKTQYLGLPIGFAFLGVSYTISTIVYSFFNFIELGWVQLFVRGFAFLVLAITYYFSKAEKNAKLLWKIILALLAIIFIVMILLVAVISPIFSLEEYRFSYFIVRTFSFLSLCYIAAHSLRNSRNDAKTVASSLGFILLAIEQYSQLIWVVDVSYFALFGGLAFRLCGLSVFLYITYKALYGRRDERDQ